MAIAPSSSSFHLLSLDDNNGHGHNHFFPSNFLTKDEEDELLLRLDASMAEELQFKEALKASLFNSQKPISKPVSAVPFLDEVKEIRGESSLNFCEICYERKENEEFFKNEKCDHSFCLDCISNHVKVKINEGFKIVTCPGFHCYSVLNDSDKNMLLSLREEVHVYKASTPSFTSRKLISAKDNDSKQIIPVNKDATSSSIQRVYLYDDDDDDECDLDALLDSEDYDSEGSPETCKNSKWFSKFVEELANLSSEEIKNPARQWHCPACQGGAGATKWYLGLQALIQHAKTEGSKRVRLHRELAQLLEENLLSSYEETSAISTVGGICPKWKGLRNENKDYEIVWPPMVIIANTFHQKLDMDKWTSMPKKELLERFRSYDGIVKVVNPYNWKGHSGFSILIFESSAMGYLEAERLHMHFTMEGIGREAWINRPVYILPTGHRQLHGFLATKEDLEMFNKHYFKGKSKLKYEVGSYQEMVGNKIWQTTEDNNQLLWSKNRVGKQQKQARELEESNIMLNKKIQTLTRDMEILRDKASQHHELSKEEVESLEQFYKQQIRTILDAKKDKDEDFEKTEQKEDEDQENANLSNINYYRYSF